MKKIGEIVKGYEIPVLNEREIRAAAGIYFVFYLISVLDAGVNSDFTLFKYFIVIFLTDFLIRIFINPKFSPSLIVGRLIVNKQTPEYVGAAQKQFAWKIGIIFASIIFILIVIVESYTIITAIICLIFLVLMFVESSFGICLGCLSYRKFYKEKAQYCSGEICDIKARHDIQKISKLQTFIVCGFIIYISVLVLAFSNNF